MLAKSANRISLLDVYLAVEEPELFAMHRSPPNDACTVGRNITAAIRGPLDRARFALENELAAVTIEDIANEIFYFPSKSAPAVRRVVLEYFNRAGIDLEPEHEVHNVVHAISMITSTRGVMMLPAYTKRYLPESITTRPVQGEVPTLDLILAYHKANKSPILKLLLSRVGKLVGAPS